MAKQKVKVTVQSDTEIFGDRTVESLIAGLQVLTAEEKAKGITGLYIDKDWNYDGGTEYAIQGYRDETDAEAKKRIDKAKRDKASRAARKQMLAERKDKSERTTYERLRKKFGD